MPITVPYLGQVAGQVPQCNVTNTGGTQVMVRGRHISRDAITSIRIAYPNFYINGTTFMEAGPGGASTVTSSIEYPIGTTVTRVTWNGQNSCSIADAAMGALSDEITVSIPIDTPFMIRTYFTNATGFVAQNKSNICDNSQSFRFATSGLSDQTGVAGATSGGTSSPNFMYKPLLIVGRTSKPSVLILGDSRQDGADEGESYTGTSDDIGQLARSIGPTYAYANLGRGSDSAVKFLASNTGRVSLRQYFSHVICAYGFNDLNSEGRTAAQHLDNVRAIRNLFPNNIFLTATLTPSTSSTDAWTSLAGQGTGQQALTDYNNLIRPSGSGYQYFDGHIEVADFAETARDSKKWITSAGGRTVTDGVTTSGSPLVVSATANFTSDDTGKYLTCVPAGFPLGTTPRTMTLSSSTTVVMSANATASLTSQTLFIQSLRYTFDGVHETTEMNQLIAAGLNLSNIQIPGVEPAPLFGVNMTKYRNAQSRSIVDSGLVNAISKVWQDTYSFSSAIPSGTTIDIAVLPKSTRVISVEAYFPSLSTGASGTGTTISIGVRNNATATGSTLFLNAGEAASGVTKLEGNSVTGLSSQMTGSTNRIYLEFGRIATATTAGTIFTVVRYT